MLQRAVTYAMIVQQFQCIQRLHKFANDVTDMFTNGQVVCNSDAEHLDGSHAANARRWRWQIVSGLTFTVCEYNFGRLLFPYTFGLYEGYVGPPC